MREPLKITIIARNKSDAEYTATGIAKDFFGRTPFDLKLIGAAVETTAGGRPFYTHGLAYTFKFEAHGESPPRPPIVGSPPT